MKITFKFAANFIDILNKEEIQVNLPDGSTLNDAITLLKELAPELFPQAEYAMHIVNNEFVAYLDTILTDESIIHLMPPMSGG